MSQSIWRGKAGWARRRWQLISPPLPARRGGASWEGGSDEAARQGDTNGAESGFGPSSGRGQTGELTPLSSRLQTVSLREGAGRGHLRGRPLGWWLR